MAKGKTQETAKSESKEALARRESQGWLASPGDLIRRFRDEMDRMFEDFGFGSLARSWPTRESFGLGLWAPQCEVYQRDNQFIIRADLPGLIKDDIKVNLTDDAITIEGERKQEHEEKEEG